MRALRVRFPDRPASPGTNPFNAVWRAPDPLHHPSADRVAPVSHPPTKRLSDTFASSTATGAIGLNLRPLEWRKLLLTPSGRSRRSRDDPS